MARYCAVAILFVLAALPMSAFAAECAVSDIVADAINQPDGTKVTLEDVFVQDVVLPYAFVTDPLGRGSHQVLAVYIKNFVVEKNWSIDVSGTMTTVEDQRVLVPSEIMVYQGADGDIFHCPFPFRWQGWPYKVDAETKTSVMDIGGLPEVPEITSGGLSEPLTATEGTIAYARLNGGDVELTGKVVTGVYHGSDEVSVSFFYVQENVVGGAGIRVVPQMSVPVEPGYLVTIVGTVVDGESSGECYIDASSVKCVGSIKRPGPAGMNNRSTAGGEFGVQPALYSDTSKTSASGGLNAVGTRVRVWGALLATSTEDGHAVCYIDDGSGLATASHDGLKVIYWNPDDAPSSQTYTSLTGVLGAEMADGKPVPVVRVPESTPWEAPGSVKYVTQNGAGDMDGSSWGSAYASSSLQTAIDAAGVGGEVWVASGTYSGSFTLADGVALYGGFAGGETLREQRDWVTNETVLDGTGQFCVVFMLECSSSTRIDGFTIRGASRSGDGGGIACHSSSPVIANNTITGNSVYFGGGMYCNSSYAVIWNNTISGNTSQSGGGGIASEQGSLLILDNVITGNSSAGSSSGGIVCYNSDSSVIMNNVISGNWACDSGGVRLQLSTAKVLCNKITGNWATAEYGGGIATYDDSSTISGNLISGNTGVTLGGGIFCQMSNTVISSNVIIDNTAAQGAGIACTSSFPGYTTKINNNTIAWNGTESTDIGDGISLAGGGCTFMVQNNIVAYNYGAGIRGATDIAYTPGHNDVIGQDTLDYVDVTAASSDISAAPGFANHDVHISASSPCYNAGTNNAVEIGDVDMDGDYRVMGSRVDIGADELPGDLVYSITFDPAYTDVPIGSTRQGICANVVRWDTGAAVSQAEVHFAVDHGRIAAISPNGSIDSSGLTGYGTSGSDGKVYVDVTCADEVYVHLTAASSTNTSETLASSRLLFYDPDDPVTLFFCIDCTVSTTENSSNSITSIKALIDDLVAQGVSLRIGGIKFNDPLGEAGIDSLNTDEQRSLSAFTTVSAFHDFLDDGYFPNGNDFEELQLDALDYAATDLAANWTYGRAFIVLTTDYSYHEYGSGSTLIKSEVIKKLESVGAPVYISLWEPLKDLPTYLQDYYYWDLTVCGGEFDPVNSGGNYKYPFALLRARILQNN
ncbi:MAG: right-handed parallel beta-helix repeat-containing protein [Armatimonadota bacterium]|nr:right-handed parallel beta-helix repeat-containing protein [bacterium]